MELTPDGESHALHALSSRSTAAGWYAWCRCGHWEGWWNGPAGQLRVLDDYDHHRRAESNGGNTPPVQ